MAPKKRKSAGGGGGNEKAAKLGEEDIPDYVKKLMSWFLGLQALMFFGGGGGGVGTGCPLSQTRGLKQLCCLVVELTCIFPSSTRARWG